MDICDFEGVLKLMQEEKVDGIIHLAAESHVDRSIKDPFTFAQTNVMGTLSFPSVCFQKNVFPLPHTPVTIMA